MRALQITCALALLAIAPRPAHAWDRGPVTTFAVLPAGSGGPEGLEVDARGNVYVGSFGFTASGPVETGAAPGDPRTQGQLFVFDRDGHLLRQVSIAGATPHLLGLHIQSKTERLLVVDFGGAQVVDIDPQATSPAAAHPFITLPDPQRSTAGLNDVTEDAQRNVYVSDSFNGIIWKTGPAGGTATAWVPANDLLKTAGVPPFGANGLRFNRAGDALFVANTGNDTVVRVPVNRDGSAGTPAVFVNSINGADGLEIDGDDNLWVVANQADEIVVVDPTGKAIAKLGDFGGAVRNGSPVGLLFPASLRFSRGALLVTNLALDLRLFNPAFVSVDSPWAAQVRRYTVSRLPLRSLR